MQDVKRPFYQPALYWFIKSLSHLIFRVIWRLEITGKENVPREGAVIFAANHRSLADPPLVGSSVPRSVTFLAKEELFRFKPFAWFITNLNATPLNRDGSDIAAFKAAKRVLSTGGAVILFPEGRRALTDELTQAKAGVGMVAAMGKCPVVPTYVHNTGHLKEFKPLKVMFGKPLFSTDFDSYQAMADAVMAEIARLKTTVKISEI